MRYPIYIISKGRWSNPLTHKRLREMGANHRVVIEPQEYDNYSAVIDPKTLLVLPFSNLGQGSIPARNWVWKHSISEGHARHWILDDNIEAFNRLNRNKKFKCNSSGIFRAAEDFTDRYKNVGLSGFNYYSFCKARDKVPPFYVNTRIYSCILIDNNLPFRWRGKYNEDTDLSLRVLKSGLCTILFNAFLAGKVTTMRMSGGNEEIYKNGRREFAESLQRQHPDVVRVTKKFNRWHHHVNYKPFKKNRLIFRDGYSPPKGVDNYGMVLAEK